jgi:hypothetical protein
VTGQITNIALNLQTNNTPTGNYYLFLRSTIDGTDMGYAYKSANSITTGWNNFTFEYPCPWIDTIGEYYLVFYNDTAQTPPNNILWGGGTTDYSGGQAYTYNGTNWNEQTDFNMSFIFYNTTSYAPGFTSLSFSGYGTTGGAVHFSSDGNWFAEASFGGYAISAWQRKGYNFYQLPAPPNQLSGTHYAVGISSNGTYLAGGSDSSPRLRLWKRNESDNNNFTQLSDPATMPPAYCTVYDIEFNPANDSYLAVSGYTFCYIYKRDNDTFTYLTALDADCQESKCAWSKDGNYFGACFRDSPYFRVWKRNGDTFTALSVDTSITSRGRGIAISSDGKYVSVGYNSYPYFAWYQNKDDKLYKQNPPGDDYTAMPATYPWDCGFSDSDKYLALAVWVSSDTYPVGIIYNLTTTIPKPTVSDATNVGTYYATFNGYMDDGGDNATWHYEYGENTSYQDTLGNMTTIATDSTTTNKVTSFLSDNDGSYNMPGTLSYVVTIKKAGYFSSLSVVKYGTTTTVTVKDSSDNVLASRTHSMIGGDNRLVTETFLPTDYTRMFVQGENITVTFSGGNWQISGGSSTTRDSDYCYISSQALPNRRDPVGVFTMLEYAVPPLNPGTLYHYRMVGNNSLGTNYSSDSLFVTKPLASTSINTTLVGNTNNITWTKGTGANNTYIEYKNGSVSSWSIGEGNFLYNGTGTYCLHENLPKGRYTYMLFGYSEWTYNGTTYYQYGDTTPIYGGYKDDPIYKSRAKYVYVAGYNPDDRIHQYWASNLTYRTQTFDLLRYIRWDVVADDDYIYVDYSGDADAYVYQIRSTDMTPIAGINDGMNYGLYTFAIDDDFVYHFGKYGSYYWSIKQFSKTDMTRTADTGSLGVVIYAMDTDDTYVYGGGGDYLIYKFLKSDMSTVTTSASYGGEIRGLAVDDNYIYIGGLTTQTIKRYWKSNLTYIDQSSSYGGDIYTLKIDDDYIYVGGDGTYKTYKYYKSNLTKAGEIASYGSTIYTLEVDDTYLYVAGDTPYKINKYKKSDLSYVSQSDSFPGTVYGLALDSPPLIDLISPSNNGYLMEQTTANLTVDACNFYEPINVTFYNASDNSILTQYNDVETGTYYYNWENLAIDYTYSWYVIVNGTIDNLKSDTYSFTPTRTPKVINFRIDEINDNNITIRWDNQPEMAWISFAISSRLSEVRKILGSQQEWFVPSMLKDTEYALVWQVGDNYSQMSDYHQFNFTTGGWASLPELTNYGYRLLVTINHTEVGSDLENYAYDLNLTDDTFRYEQDWVSYPGFTHLNWTTLNDIRFVDYYRQKYLEYNVSDMNIPGAGGISTQVVPDENYSTGSFATEEYAHDTDWLTQATPAPYGVLYYNYTIPVGAKITSKFRVYQGEWIWDVTLPEGAYNGSKLQFKSECDYDTPYIATSVWNYETSTWDMIQNDTARYFYESQIGWEYDAYASVYVMPEHFNDTSLENEKGIDGDYDTKFWMYYGYTGATDAQTTLS